MNWNEMIFIAVAILAYILCAFTLNIHSFAHIIFGIGLLAIVLIAIALKFKPQLENEKISKIFQILLVIVFIFYVAAIISELWFAKTLIVDSGILFFALIIMIVLNWLFKK
jgi:hypothetical protein